MQNIRIEKLTLNIGAGKDPAKLEKGITLIKTITGIDPIKTITTKRIAEWGLRPGLPIGCKITLRKTAAKELFARLVKAKDSKIKDSSIDNKGNISLGIHEYIDIPGVAYNPAIGVIGLQACLTLEKPGYRIKKRKVKPKKIPQRHTVNKQEAITFLQKSFNTKIEEEA